MQIKDFMDLKKLQEIQDKFSNSTGPGRDFCGQ